MISGAIVNGTAASQAQFGKKMPAKRRKKRAKKKTATRRKAPAKRATRRAAPKGRLKKGSPAAKRRMAQLRAMQKRKR